MGDALLFLMIVEETFDVEIPDEEVEQLRTFGELADWLASRLRQRIAPLETVPCLNVYAFNCVRRALNSPLKVRPRTSLEELLPAPNLRHLRRAQWDQLGTQISEIPPLQWAPRLKTTLETLWFAAAAISSIPALFISFNLPVAHSWLFGWVPVAFGFTAYFLLLGSITASVHFLLRSFKIYAPFSTVGELTHHLANQNYWQLASERGSWSESEMWRALQNIGAREAEVETDEVRRDTPFDELLYWD